MSEVFATRLKDLLEADNIQQKSIATTLKVSPAVFSAWIKCKSEPSLDMFAKICKELNVSADYMLGLTNIASPKLNSKDGVSDIFSDLNKTVNNTLITNPLDGLSDSDRQSILTLINSLKKNYSTQSENNEIQTKEA